MKSANDTEYVTFDTTNEDTSVTVEGIPIEQDVTINQPEQQDISSIQFEPSGQVMRGPFMWTRNYGDSSICILRPIPANLPPETPLVVSQCLLVWYIYDDDGMPIFVQNPEQQYVDLVSLSEELPIDEEICGLVETAQNGADIPQTITSYNPDCYEDISSEDENDWIIRESDQ